MAGVRAYKLAEELGIEKNEFVEKARGLGIDLKNAMAALSDEQTALLREKLGGRRSASVTEARVVRSGTTAVIRRRKRAEPEAVVPEPEFEAHEPPAVAAEPFSGAEPEPALPEAPEELLLAETPPQPVAEEPRLPTPPGAEALREATAPRPPRAGAPAAAASTEAGGPGAGPDRKGRQRKQFKEVVNLKEQEQFARQVTGRVAGRPVLPVDPRAFSSPRRRRRDTGPVRPVAAAAVPRAARRVLRVEGGISVAELARQIGVKAADLQGRLMGLGTMVSVNQVIDVATAERVAKEFGWEVQDIGFQEAEFLEAPAEAASEETRVRRPPVVTVMGHVDHGKTSLLDALRKTNVVAGEAGGITQHIGAYQVQVGEQTLTFIDTPGHAAFTAMRARGAQATDVVILVVAASEGIMPQTVEAIDHARAAGVPIVVAVNKCDLPDANPRMVRQRLMEHGLVPEEFGGEVLCVDVSAVKGTGLDTLLETVSLQAEILDLRADPAIRAKGVVLEAELDKGRGPLATVLVQEGTLRRGDVVVVGKQHGRVRSLMDEHGDMQEQAGPSTPMRVIGLSGVPAAGDLFHVVESERVARQIVGHREEEQRQRPEAPRFKLSLEELFGQADGGPKELNVVLKGDAQGSVEAVREALLKLPSDKVKLNVLHAGVGGITEGDVQLAQASRAVVVGFHVRPDGAARRAAENAGVDLRVYQVIYELLDELRAAMAGLLPPSVKEKLLGRAEVRRTFNVPRVGTVAGCYVLEGLIRRNAGARLVRDGIQVHQGRFASLKRFKDDVREVQTGFECGIGIEGYNDLKIGDVIEAFEHEEIPAEL